VFTQVDYTKISDPYYFQDLTTDQIGVKSADYVNQQGAISYRGDSYTARLNAQAYQWRPFRTSRRMTVCRRSLSMVSCHTIRRACVSITKRSWFALTAI